MRKCNYPGLNFDSLNRILIINKYIYFSVVENDPNLFPSRRLSYKSSFTEFKNKFINECLIKSRNLFLKSY